MPIESRQVSEKYLCLVENLTPPGRNYEVPSPTAYRSRFVLFILARLANDDGECTASLSDLSALTVLVPPMVRSAIRALEDDGLVEVVRDPSSPNLYRLNRDALEAQQYAARLRARGPVTLLLGEYGLDTRSLNTLHRIGLDTIPKLGAKVEEYRRLVAAGTPLAFHEFLETRNMGERSARKILNAYDAWCVEQGLIAE